MVEYRKFIEKNIEPGMGISTSAMVLDQSMVPMTTCALMEFGLLSTYNWNFSLKLASY